MNIIVTVDNNYGISYKGKSLVSIPADRKLKVQEVEGKVAVYGLGGLEDLPGKQPLATAMNIIFTDGVKTSVKTGKNTVLCASLEEVRETLKKYPDEDIYIIDNEKLYREFLPDTRVCHVTKVDYEYKADAFFENLEKNPDFKITRDSDEQYCFDIVYSFLQFERI